MPTSIQTRLQYHALLWRARLVRLTQGRFNPYPQPPHGSCFDPSARTLALAAEAPLRLQWGPAGSGELAQWQAEARKKLHELIKFVEPPQLVHISSTQEQPFANGYTRQRHILQFGEGQNAPIDIVTPNGSPPNKAPPVIICMQGSNTGAHLSLGEVRHPTDIFKINAGSALALQAADEGYIAVSYERPCYGERREQRYSPTNPSKNIDAAFHLLTLGKSLIGQIVEELVALRHWIETDVSPGSPVYLAGYSEAGTAAIAAAAASDAFAGLAVGGCVGLMRDTVLTRRVSGLNEIPGMLEWFEFDALLSLISPRPLLIISGRKDHIWPYEGAERAVESARSAYLASGTPRAFCHEQAPEGHTYYPEIMWPIFNGMIS
ncbi:MAG: hypothetical protein HQ501_07465 [Rhodospirillales bacterium]|nr:hypothetical protein [Rhodospirillales bacterium]